MKIGEYSNSRFSSNLNEYYGHVRCKAVIFTTRIPVFESNLIHPSPTKKIEAVVSYEIW